MWHSPGRVIKRAQREQTGQSLVIIVVAFFALLVIVGLAIDLGLMYIERIQLGRACDAAALAGAQELPMEDLAAQRAMQYLTDNGYDLAELGLTVIGPDNAGELSHPRPPGSRGDFIIEAHQYQDPDFEVPSDKLSVTGTIDVPMSFMVLVGFDSVPVEAHAMAENVLNRLDIAIVYDKSGSMNDDTYCHNCFNEGNPAANPPPECYGCYSRIEGLEFPLGDRMYLPVPNEFCGPQQEIIHNGYEILVAEAEWFSNSTSVAGGANDYHRQDYVEGTTFWMLQRVRNSQASGHSSQEGDRRGAHLMHLPMLEDIPGHNDTANAPRLDYNFDLPTAGNWFVWARAQCGPWPANAARADGCLLHWGANGSQIGSIGGGSFGGDGAVLPSGCYCGTQPCPCRPPREGGSRSNQWTWVQLGSVNTGSSDLQINLWGGGPGFRLDKLLLTRNPEGPGGGSDRAPLFIRETTPDWDDVDDLPYQTYELNGRYGGPPDTGGRNGLACDICNAQYGGNREAGCDKTLDDIFDDAQPVRAAKEAAKSFVRRMRARFDQIAFVEYETRASISRELNCVWQRGVPPVEYGLGIWDPETGQADNAWTWCYDHRVDPGGYEGAPDTSINSGSVIFAVESMQPAVWTNIAEGMELGMDVLEPTGGHFGRPYALRYMILMTDGVPNRWPGGENAECHQDPDLWPDESGDENEDKARDCVIYYADQAKAKGVAIFTIGLGMSVDGPLLQAVAERTGGDYFHARRAEELNAVFDEIANRIFLRLVE
jgi:hypothetical protein